MKLQKNIKFNSFTCFTNSFHDPEVSNQFFFSRLQLVQVRATDNLIVYVAVIPAQSNFLGSYALHTDPIVRGNLVSLSVCQYVSVSVCHFEVEKTRDTKTSGR